MEVNEWFVTFNRFFFLKRNFCESQSHEDYFRESTISGTGSLPNSNSLVSAFFMSLSEQCCFKQHKRKEWHYTAEKKHFISVWACDVIQYLSTIYSQYKMLTKELAILLAVKAEFLKTLNNWTKKLHIFSHNFPFFSIDNLFSSEWKGLFLFSVYPKWITVTKKILNHFAHHTHPSRKDLNVN